MTVKELMSKKALSAVNTGISSVHTTLHSRPIALAMNQSARTSWEGVCYSTR